MFVCMFFMHWNVNTFFVFADYSTQQLSVAEGGEVAVNDGVGLGLDPPSNGDLAGGGGGGSSAASAASAGLDNLSGPLSSSSPSSVQSWSSLATVLLASLLSALFSSSSSDLYSWRRRRRLQGRGGAVWKEIPPSAKACMMSFLLPPFPEKHFRRA